MKVELTDGIYRAFDPGNPFCEGYGATRAEAMADALGNGPTAAPEPPATVIAKPRSKRTGRPRQYGMHPGWMGVRALLLLAGYIKERTRGHDAGIKAAVREVEIAAAEMPVSEGAVHRILAEFYPEKVRRWLRVRGPKHEAAYCVIGPDGAPIESAPTREAAEQIAREHSGATIERRRFKTYTASVSETDIPQPSRKPRQRFDFSKKSKGR